MIEWVACSEKLPPFNRRVVAWLEGEQFHSGVNWVREGFAFMVRHEGTDRVVKDGWASAFYDMALKSIGADCARVTHWCALYPPAKEAP